MTQTLLLQTSLAQTWLEWVDWANHNQGAITAVATVVMALTALVLVRLAAGLARDNRRLRRAAAEPVVIAFLQPHPRIAGALDFVLANVGRGPALEVSFGIIAGGEDFEGHEASLRAPSVPLSVILAGERYSTYFGMGWQAFRGGPRLAPFTVEVRYDGLKKRKHARSCVIDIGQFEGRVTLEDQPDREIAAAVKDIAKDIHGLLNRNLTMK